MKIIITVVGKDQLGIVAKVSSKLAELNVNIVDISQTLMRNDFTMMLLGHLDTKKNDFKTVQDSLSKLGKEINVNIRVQRQEVFDAIQKL
ncbi:UPF0237 protein [Philodulcilactobacillus myokoensis]|uniref:UPF0237 protein WR164_02370 n=1 Tax=Philodulcilactobacillus myokoensis TaxID=2929573 RepID=A0A9W6B0L8_9LACO|nr:ACT domain-containing protein [Philodulcilactobacillus myokoensis]GLB46258.1 UPF0237 protein [Philodulcilactobacillus myokoensis]